MVYILIIAVVAVSDLLIKNYIERYYWNNKDKYIFGKFINIKKYRNEGGFLNIFEKKTRFVKYASLTVLGIVLCIFVLLFNKKRMKLLKTGLALVIGGAFSNEYDRIVNGGVTDYFSFSVKGLDKVVFNMGDMAIFAGLVLIMKGYNGLRKQEEDIISL